MENKKSISCVVNKLLIFVWAIWAGVQYWLFFGIVALWVEVLVREKWLGIMMFAASYGMCMILLGAIILAAIVLLINVILLIVGKKKKRQRMVKINNVWLWINLYALPLMLNGCLATGMFCMWRPM